MIVAGLTWLAATLFLLCVILTMLGMIASSLAGLAGIVKARPRIPVTPRKPRALVTVNEDFQRLLAKEGQL